MADVFQKETETNHEEMKNNFMSQLVAIKSQIATPNTRELLVNMQFLERWLQKQDQNEDVYHQVPMVHQMLITRPIHNKKNRVAIWESLRHMSIYLFQEFRDRIDPSTPLFDSDTYYDEWDGKRGLKYQGTRHRETKAKHGICRWASPEHGIIEASYKHGKVHGLRRQVY